MFAVVAFNNFMSYFTSLHVLKAKFTFFTDDEYKTSYLGNNRNHNLFLRYFGQLLRPPKRQGSTPKARIFFLFLFFYFILQGQENMEKIFRILLGNILNILKTRNQCRIKI